MKVILLKNIEKLGNAGEVKNVSPGYARNYLIRQNFAKPVTESILSRLDIEKKLLEAKAEKELKITQELVAKIDGLEIVIPMKVGEKNQSFGSISAQKIIDNLLEKGFKVSKDQIILEKQIKTLGEHMVPIKFDHNLEAKLRIIAEAEKE